MQSVVSHAPTIACLISGDCPLWLASSLLLGCKTQLHQHASRRWLPAQTPSEWGVRTFRGDQGLVVDEVGWVCVHERQHVPVRARAT